MWRTSRTVPMPINARSTAWAARRWPAPAEPDSTSTLHSSAMLLLPLRDLLSDHSLNCNEPGQESEEASEEASEDKRRSVSGVGPRAGRTGSRRFDQGPEVLSAVARREARFST